MRRELKFLVPYLVLVLLAGVALAARNIQGVRFLGDGTVGLAELVTEPGGAASFGTAWVASTGIAFVRDETGVSHAITPPTLHYQHQETSGTAGGTLTLGDWRTRTITTEVADTHGLGALLANQITLPLGTYEVWITVSAYAVDTNQIRLYDITNDAVLLLGLNSHSPNGGDVGNQLSTLRGVITLTAETVLEIQHRSEATENTDGFGFPTSWGTEVYLDAVFILIQQ